MLKRWQKESPFSEGAVPLRSQGSAYRSIMGLSSIILFRFLILDHRNCSIVATGVGRESRKDREGSPAHWPGPPNFLGEYLWRLDGEHWNRTASQLVMNLPLENQSLSSTMVATPSSFHQWARETLCNLQEFGSISDLSLT